VRGAPQRAPLSDLRSGGHRATSTTSQDAVTHEVEHSIGAARHQLTNVARDLTRVDHHVLGAERTQQLAAILSPRGRDHSGAEFASDIHRRLASVPLPGR
jgi:hypothetical protein